MSNYSNEESWKVDNQQEIDLSEVASVPFAQGTALSASTGFPSLPADATKAVVNVEGQPVRWRPDGSTTAPTTAIGMLLPVGSTTVFVYSQAALAAVRFIETAASAKINVTYFK